MHEEGLEEFLPLPHSSITPPPTSSTTVPGSANNGSPNQSPLNVGDHTSKTFDSPSNVFGIFRRYHHPSLSSGDAFAQSTTLPTSSDVPDPVSTPPDFDPYPNETCFLLGEWYWNGGIQKSQKDFMRLISIISRDSFSPADIRKANWKLINQSLAANDWDNGEWVDEDAGWHRKTVSIQVPFNSRMKTPGPQTFAFGKFYYRSLKAVIVEKLQSKSATRYFQTEPYELLWKYKKDSEPIRLYGELYNSPAFIDAHREIQNMPGEPGCNLPRCVVGLMFWSDATHLTASGHTKLWPLYMGFGNDSKYERCKPSKHLLEHVAYFEKNQSIDSVFVERELVGESLTASSNAFSECLSKFLNLFSLFVVDLMHEVEAGTWKDTLTHLLRILASIDQNLLHELDKRFRQVPTFGRDTIRRFSSNASDLSHMAARDYEDFLQCAIPVFEGLFPEPHNSQFLGLMFSFAHWHGLAKLRMHSDPTLDLLDKATTVLGNELRLFLAISMAFKTTELKKEADARKRKEQRAKKKTGSRKAPRDSVRQGKSKEQGNSTTKANGNHSDGAYSFADEHESAEVSTSTSRRKKKDFSLTTYKNHAMGDYVETIRMYGTTESYSTELGELEHRNPKGKYKRTSRKAFTKQLAEIERRQARIRRMRQSISDMPEASESLDGQDDYGCIAAADKSEHHQIGLSENNGLHLGQFLRKHLGDPATRNFLLRLKQHIAQRLETSIREDNAPRDEFDVSIDVNNIFISKDTMYGHNIMRVNYTTYDVRRAQDTINPNTDHRDIMVLSRQFSHDGGHQYGYGRVLGIYHVNVIFNGVVLGKQDYRLRRMEFLWVRWYETADVPVQQGWANRSLDQLKFMSLDDENAFGFIDPRDVLRACHIVPRFCLGRKHDDAYGKGISKAAQEYQDWNAYFVNRFVDRDMLMRYHWGLGVGHVYSRKTTSLDRDLQIDREDQNCSDVNVDHTPNMPASMVEAVCPQTSGVNAERVGSESENSEDSEGSSDSDDSRSEGSESASDEELDQGWAQMDLMYGDTTGVMHTSYD
ncbi:hypothetical protein Hypma_005389 [Hypsizygus marmoreus]|uniref:Uncharacterized protein n=1 Tax=Hypsizygus marmoreus TaxID=39966 RepID=A0A369JYJ9_HYPMA|nr:hypothetical protein Hypma_005389 [Hypsizygus marmoreus]